MPPFWDPICPPLGIVCLKSYLEKQGSEVHIVDFNTNGYLFNLQRRYFELGMEFFPHWKFLNIYRNGPRYFARHRLAFLFSRQQRLKYEKLVSAILNFDNNTLCNKKIIRKFDYIIEESFKIVESQTKKLINKINPGVVGCTMLESTFPSALAILKKAKEIDPKIIAVLGGPGAIVGNTVEDGNLESVIERCGWIDAIIYGEGERLLERYLEGHFKNKKIISIQDLKEELGGVDDSGALLDVNDISVPNYEGLSLSGYLWLSVFNSRGCPYKCSFCYENSYWARYRKKDLKQFIKEMQILSKQYGKNKFYICDSLVNNIATELSLLLTEIEETFRWDCYMRISAECAEKEKVKLWSRAGMYRIRIGIESASERILKLMNKNIPLDQTRQSLMNFADSGICTTTLWIAGFPGESERDFEESMEFLKENHRFIFQADIWEYVCLPARASYPEAEDSNFLTKRIYPGEFGGLLPIKYYDLEKDPSSFERFKRISKFEKLRMKLGIPNPYSIRELLEAQVRWMKLGHPYEQ